MPQNALVQSPRARPEPWDFFGLGHATLASTLPSDFDPFSSVWEGAPKCVGTAASGPVPNLRIFFGFSGFRNSAPGCAGQPCQWVGRMGEWPGSQWRAGWTEGALGPAGPLRLREPGPAPCLPDSIDVCLAVWEQFWCDRAGLFCGSLAFHRVRRRLVRRGPSRGKTYAYPEGHPQWLRRRSA